MKKLLGALKNVRGVVLRLLLPWAEGIILTPDFGHDQVVNVLYFTWLCFHVRIILKDRPFQVPVNPAPASVDPAAK